MADPHVIDIASFRILFPQFAGEVAYPDATLTAFFGSATVYFGEYDNYALYGQGLQTALNLMTAHLLAIGTGAAAGTGGGGVVTGSTIDKVSVTLMAPPARSGWQFWLAGSPYGLQLWALLKIKSAGGFHVGGLPERDGFRRVGGGFGPCGARGRLW